ncbi:MAG: carbohydrate-binding protein, partial [Sphingobacteriaceae bacterium]
VYHYNASLKSATKMPEYYDKALFMFDWMRNWVFVVRLDENQNYRYMESFMESNGDFRRPIDMEVGPDGSFYMLEYGSVYGIDNIDARLVRIDYNGGNRAPVAKIDSRELNGIAPFKVNFSQKSFDYDDEDKLTYEWNFGNNVTSAAQNPEYIFQNNGIYKVSLKVRDAAGASSSDTIVVKVGNTAPQVTINTTNNASFFFPAQTSFNYAVEVKDNEDGFIDKRKVKVALDFIARVERDKNLAGHQAITPTYNYGKELIAKSDCKACHQINAKSVGPAFVEVAKRYFGDKDAVTRLSNKIITGGGGVWGEHAMSAHPQLSKDDAAEMVKYILTISTKKDIVLLQQSGAAALKDHVAVKDQGRYILSASYTDNGGKITPLTTRETLVLRPAKVQAEDADLYFDADQRATIVGSINNRSYFMFKSVDLKGITKLTYRYASSDKSGTITVHTDSPKGPVISTLNFEPTMDWNTFKNISAPITDPGAKHDLYFVFTQKLKPNNALLDIDWIAFEK